MIGEKICFAGLFIAEALTAWLYLEYLFSREKTVRFLTCSFVIGYVMLYACRFISE